MEGEEVKNSVKPYIMEQEERMYPWIERDTPYGLQHALQNFDICLPRPLEESPKESTVWVLYVPRISHLHDVPFYVPCSSAHRSSISV